MGTKSPHKPSSKSSSRRRASATRPQAAKRPARKAPAAPVARDGQDAVARRSVVKPYRPRADESYMCARQIDHFREVFEAIRQEINLGMDLTVTHMRESPNTIPDENDRASKESEFTIELRERDRDRNLLGKIARALGRIQTGDFGFCESCGDEIGLDRLLARPVTTMCIECKQMQEYREKTFAK